MRSILITVFLMSPCAQVVASPPDSVEPGIGLDAAKSILAKHGFEVNGSKYGLAMVATDRQNKLEFCLIDSAITLVIVYRESTRMIVSLSVVVIPVRAPKADRAQIERNVLAIVLEEDGIYSLKMKRSE